jgi:hypothetical protein
MFLTSILRLPFTASPPDSVHHLKEQGAGIIQGTL